MNGSLQAAHGREEGWRREGRTLGSGNGCGRVLVGRVCLLVDRFELSGTTGAPARSDVVTTLGEAVEDRLPGSRSARPSAARGLDIHLGRDTVGPGSPDRLDRAAADRDGPPRATDSPDVRVSRS